MPPSVSDGDLPPDVSEEGSGSDVCLPSPALGTKCACKNMCYEKVSLQAVRDFREQHLNLSEEDRARQVYAAVKSAGVQPRWQSEARAHAVDFPRRPCLPAFLGVRPRSGGHAGVGMAKNSDCKWGLMGLLNDSPGFLLRSLSSTMQTHGSLTSTRAWGSRWQKVTHHFLMSRAVYPSMMQITRSGPCASPSTLGRMPQSGI